MGIRKTPMDFTQPAARDMQRAYKMGDVVHVPHYNRKGEYVSPGYGRHHMERYTAAQLVAMGAKPCDALLWPRSKVAIDRDAL